MQRVQVLREISAPSCVIIRGRSRVADAAVASNDQSAGAKVNKSRGLEAALTLYRAAKGAEVPGTLTTVIIVGTILGLLFDTIDGFRKALRR